MGYTKASLVYSVLKKKYLTMLHLLNRRNWELGVNINVIETSRGTSTQIMRLLIQMLACPELDSDGAQKAYSSVISFRCFPPSLRL